MKNFLGPLNLEEIGKRLAYVDRHLYSVLGVRLGYAGLSDLVALIKRSMEQRARGSPIFKILRPDVESQRLAMARAWAKQNGVDPNFADALMFSVISESCRVQGERNYQGQWDEIIDPQNEENVRQFQRSELLRLTEAVAGTYDEIYPSRFFGTGLYLKFERKQLGQVVKDLLARDILVDLGCATGVVALEFAGRFKRAVGYDLSPHMVAQAESKRQAAGLSQARLEFSVVDVETSLPLPDRCASLVVMNFGTASDVRNLGRVLEETKRVLNYDGKFVFSFYNADSLVSAFEFLPWPAPTAAFVDASRQSLEVHYGGEVYLLYARPYTVREVKELMVQHGLAIDKIMTHPMVSAIVPTDLLVRQEFVGYGEREAGSHALAAEIREVPNQRLMNMLADIDERLAFTHPHHGSYILVVGQRSAH